MNGGDGLVDEKAVPLLKRSATTRSGTWSRRRSCGRYCRNFRGRQAGLPFRRSLNVREASSPAGRQGWLRPRLCAATGRRSRTYFQSARPDIVQFRLTRGLLA